MTVAFDRQGGVAVLTIDNPPVNALKTAVRARLMELAEELVVEVVAIGEHHQGGVGHRRMAHDAGGIEEHREALATALGVPHHAALALQLGRAVGAGSRHHLLYGRTHRVVLVIASNLLDQLPVVFK